jgi:hypothetical protein
MFSSPSLKGLMIHIFLLVAVVCFRLSLTPRISKLCFAKPSCSVIVLTDFSTINSQRAIFLNYLSYVSTYLILRIRTSFGALFWGRCREAEKFRRVHPPSKAFHRVCNIQ